MMYHINKDVELEWKDDVWRAKLNVGRKMLERNTTMLLISSKACLRHPDSSTAKEMRDTVFIEMRRAIDIIHGVVRDGVLPALAAAAATTVDHQYRASRRNHRNQAHVSRYTCSSSDSSNRYVPHEWPMNDNNNACRTAFSALQKFEELVDMSRITLCRGTFRNRLLSAFDDVVELTQDFTDSAYTRHDHREKILLLCDRAKSELNQLLGLGIILDEAGSTAPTEDFENSVAQTIQAVDDVKNQLRTTALDQAEELFRLTNETDIIDRLRTISLVGDLERLEEYAKSFHEHCDHFQEVCRLLHNVACTPALQISSRNTELLIHIYGPQILNACKTACMHPSSKIAKDNLDIFLDYWILLFSDVHQLSKDIREESVNYNYNAGPQYYIPHPNLPPSSGRQSRLSKNDHSMQAQSSSSQFSPPPVSQPSSTVGSSSGHHGGAEPSLYKPAKPLDSEEQARIAETGLEMKKASTQLDAEAEKWPNPEDNDIVRRAKAMSQMAFSMYQFTRGEGELKTTQDLFTQAEFFAEEANKFYKLVRHFTYQVPSGPTKKELLDHLDKVPTFVQQLQFSVKNSTVGKAATYTKVDNVIKETKNLMNYVSKTVNSCLTCSSEHNVDLRAVRTRSRTLSPSGRFADDKTGFEGMSSGMGEKGGTAASDPNI
ncbi:alpha-catenin related isoform X2 [Brevipalpus obovatus]|uniref:alpha-catenin related isoform X2 n=1 Tax=Brevipalpus obovatus TaxID=246614 RepID=UPI003D9FA60C